MSCDGVFARFQLIICSICLEGRMVWSIQDWLIEVVELKERICEWEWSLWRVTETKQTYLCSKYILYHSFRHHTVQHTIGENPLLINKRLM